MNRIDRLEEQLTALKEDFDVYLEKFAEDANNIILTWLEEENIPNDLRYAVLIYYNYWLDDMMLNLSTQAVLQEDFIVHQEV